MAKDTKYIRKRKRKYGYAFLIDIPFVDEEGTNRHFTETIKIIEFDGKKKPLCCMLKKSEMMRCRISNPAN